MFWAESEWLSFGCELRWIPAFAGMTKVGDFAGQQITTGLEEELNC